MSISSLIIVAVAVLASLGALLGPRIALRPNRLAALVGRASASTWLLAGAAVVVAIAATTTWHQFQHALAATMQPVDNGWLQDSTIPDQHSNLAQSLAASIEVQTWACWSLLGLCSIGLFGPLFGPGLDITGEHAGHRRLWRPKLAQLAIRSALLLPIVVGCIGIQTVLADMRGANLEGIRGMAWQVLRDLETYQWAIAITAAFTLTAATPLVAKLASRGHVVSHGFYRASQLIALAGFAAWVGVQPLAQDLVQGPKAELERSAMSASDPTSSDPTSKQVLSTPMHDITLPIGVCRTPGTKVVAAVEIPLVLDRDAVVRWGDTELAGATAWAKQAARVLAGPRDRGTAIVVAAAIDRRLSSAEIRPFLERAQALGGNRISIVAFGERVSHSHTLGKVRRRYTCELDSLTTAETLDLLGSTRNWMALARHLTQ